MTRSHQAMLPIVIAALISLITACTAATPSDLNRTITLTLVRHGQSEGNASGIMDTKVPGPPLTDLGEAQAHMIANRLGAHDYDGVYASTMVRTQQTAEPTADKRDEDIAILSGLREIEAGDYEGMPESTAARTYYHDIVAWVQDRHAARIPGSVDGVEFDKRYDDAVETIYGTGDSNPIAFSHGAAIAAWTMMNVDNARPGLMVTEPLPNTGYVVVTGKPDHWTLVDWNGTRVE